MPSTTFRIGKDLTVGRLGFGAMHLPTERPGDRPSAVAVARRAVELGITLIDTAHLYGAGANEEVLAEAREIVDIASVQNRYNLTDREHEPVLAACEAADIAFLPWRTVAWGKAGDRAEVAAVAAELDATPTQVCLAWLLARSPVVLPIPGTSSIAHLEENTAAADLALTPELRGRLDGIAASA
ncbi:aldo/keto reductase [Streptomyces sindenensis]|uniref:Aldo/keto reductase n=1 Tax=Streptomyces sindenensis TaxID=67363 RepID=A0ABW6EP06_9ACTN